MPWNLKQSPQYSCFCGLVIRTLFLQTACQVSIVEWSGMLVVPCWTEWFSFHRVMCTYSSFVSNPGVESACRVVQMKGNTGFPLPWREAPFPGFAVLCWMKVLRSGGARGLCSAEALRAERGVPPSSRRYPGSGAPRDRGLCSRAAPCLTVRPISMEFYGRFHEH